jgi:hypothetical protein
MLLSEIESNEGEGGGGGGCVRSSGGGGGGGGGCVRSSGGGIFVTGGGISSEGIFSVEVRFNGGAFFDFGDFFGLFEPAENRRFSKN